MSAPSIGEVIPDFTLPATGEREIGSAQLRGRWLVLFFYPKASTPGCTQEGKDFRDAQGEFEQLGCTLLGVSRDGIKAQTNFKIKQGFAYELLSDKDETLCKAFDVIKLKKLYGKEYLGVERSTFLIDPQGVLRREWRKVSVKGHVAEVLAALGELAG